jgi:thioesterase domain-containing protein
MSVSVPVATLLSAPTIEGLARIVDGQTDNQRSGVVVPLRGTGTRPPLFMVAGVGGHVLIFRELAELLGDDQPVYGLQGIGLDGKEAPLSKMEDIAVRYLQEIVSIQPEGPHFIVGWSMGGVIGYAIAQELLKQGRRLGALVIIDAYAPWSVSLSDRLRIHLASFRKRSWRSRFRYLRQRLSHQVEVMARRLGFDRVEGLDGPTADRVRNSSLAQYQALAQYRPPPFPGSIALLRAEQTAEIRDPRADDPNLGWARLVQGDIRTLPISGSHTGIFVGQNVQTVAAAVRTALGMAADKTSPSTAQPEVRKT